MFTYEVAPGDIEQVLVIGAKIVLPGPKRGKGEVIFLEIPGVRSSWKFTSNPGLLEIEYIGGKRLAERVMVYLPDFRIIEAQGEIS